MILFLGGAARLLLGMPVTAAGGDTPPFADEPAAHAAYDRMMAALHQARSLSYTSRYEYEAGGRPRVASTYQVWLKKPSFFRMEARSDDGEPEGVMIGDGTRLWIHWPKGRPKWEYVAESAADRETRFTSFLTKPAPPGRHSIWHEGRFLSSRMILPVLNASEFHGHVDSLERYLGPVRRVGVTTIGGEDCDEIEISLVDHQRSRHLELSRRDHLPRKLREVVRVNSDVVVREEWSAVVVDAELPDGMFAWSTPAGWTEWKLPDEDAGLLKPGSKAPDFDLASIDRGRIKLADFRGKLLWLCFWRVGCPPCRREMPDLQALYAKHKEQGLVVLGVNVSDDKAITRDFLRDQGVTFPNILDTSPGAEEVCARDYRVGSLPLNYLIDGDCVIVDGWLDYREGEARLKSALQIHASGATKPER